MDDGDRGECSGGVNVPNSAPKTGCLIPLPSRLFPPLSLPLSSESFQVRCTEDEGEGVYAMSTVNAPL
jgi:hypothetical protein